MKKILLAAFLIIGLNCFAQTNQGGNKQSNSDQTAILYDSLQYQMSEMREYLEEIIFHIEDLEFRSDSIDDILLNDVKKTKFVMDSRHSDAAQKIKLVDSASQTNYEKLTTWGLWAIAGLLVLAIIVYLLLHRGISKSSNAISSIRQAQNNLLEESIRLDTKLLEILEKQINLENKEGSDSKDNPGEIDESLALKVSEEIARIELNLSRVDPSVKGYKSLVKAMEKFKTNFNKLGLK